MKIVKIGITVLLMFYLTACATQSPFVEKSAFFTSKATGSETESATKSPRLTLTATPRQGFAPMRVTIHAVLENVDPADTQLHCLQESWIFGDGSSSAEKPDCAGTTINKDGRLEYFVEHVYKRTGDYNVRFVLGNNDYNSKPLAINVIANRMGY